MAIAMPIPIPRPKGVGPPAAYFAGKMVMPLATLSSPLRALQ